MYGGMCVELYAERVVTKIVRLTSPCCDGSLSQLGRKEELFWFLDFCHRNVVGGVLKGRAKDFTRLHFLIPHRPR